MQKNKYTIKDIAKMANLSRGTVDKVIHKRGGVSEENIRRVQEIIDQVNYKPNLLARSLKNHKTFIIGVVVPEYKTNSYWKKCMEGIKRAEDEFQTFGGVLKYYVYKKSKKDYLNQFEKLESDGVDAALVIPINYVGSEVAFELLQKNNIPFNFINSYVDGTQFKSFIGQDYYKSGRVAAQIMNMILPSSKSILIIHHIEESEHSTHLENKEKGFRDVFNEQLANRKIDTKTIAEDELRHEDVEIEVSGYQGIFLTSSHTYKFLDALNPENDIKIIGYDLVPENIDLLRKGKIDIILHQNPEKQGFLGIQSMGEYLLYEKSYPKWKHLPIDIVTSENLDGYLSI